jgi:hypothetical protein
MLSDDNQSGLFYLLVGSIVVVLAGVGISMMVDHRFSFSRNATDLQRDITSGETELDQLKSTYQENSAQMARSEPKARMLADNYQSLLRQLRNLDQRRTALEESGKDLKTSLRALQEEFLGYKDQYRAKTWAEAVGQSLGNLQVRGGREFRKAVILEVDKVGLRISHEEGSARVQAQDLDPALQDRFQWDDQESRAQLNQELLNQESITADPVAKPAKDVKPAPPTRATGKVTTPDAKKLESLRRTVSAWKSKVAQLNFDRNEALSKAATGRQVSVPGSLETWQSRAASLGKSLAKAKEELSAAKALLQDLNPGDSLLVPDNDRH